MNVDRFGNPVHERNPLRVILESSRSNERPYIHVCTLATHVDKAGNPLGLRHIWDRKVTLIEAESLRAHFEMTYTGKDDD